MRTEGLAAIAVAMALATGARGDDLVVLVDRVLDGTGRPMAVQRLDIVDSVLSVARAPEATRVIDARGLVVVPGFIDLRSGAGLDDATEESSEVTPDLPALRLVDPGDASFDAALAAGVTTAVVAPDGRAVIGGLAEALKTDDRPLLERALGRDAALVITLGPEPTLGNRLARFQTPTGLHFRRPGDRMGVVSEIRRAFLSAQDGAAGSASSLRRALAGDLPTWWRARAEQDIRTAVRLSREFGMPPPVLLDPVEAHRVPEFVGRECRAAVIGPSYQIPRSMMEGWEGEDFRHATAKLLHDAGAVVAIATGPDDPAGILRDRAALAVRAGLPADVALAGITSVPASLLGLSGRLGSLAPGHDGDLVILDGEPLALTSRVLAVVVEGRVAWSSPDAPAGLQLPATIPQVAP